MSSLEYFDNLSSDIQAISSLFTLGEQMIQNSQNLTEINMIQASFSASQIDGIMNNIYEYQLENIVNLNMTYSS